ncbi:MAG TPA: electron transfer flavoprotein subunit beta/FixA family protein [Planctomycetota bacterium]|nr:electron transfer flavoprotein subunit beta/FixA family protein [Planctomycetota bacterium]
MILAVCLKRVPATNARPSIGPDGKSINPQGIEYVVNPYDEFAIEEALKIKEKAGAGEVVGISVDPDGNESMLRKALAMGVDRGILVKGGSTFDGAVNAEILAGVLKPLGATIIFFGKQAVDSDSCQVPTLVAELLGLPRANVVVKMELQGNRVTCRRQVEGAEEVVDMSTPCVVSAQKGLNEPRYASLKGIMAAKKKPIETVAAPAVEARIEVLKMEPPPPRPAGRIVGKGKEAVAELVRLLRDEAKVL